LETSKEKTPQPKKETAKRRREKIKIQVKTQVPRGKERDTTFSSQPGPTANMHCDGKKGGGNSHVTHVIRKRRGKRKNRIKIGVIQILGRSSAGKEKKKSYIGMTREPAGKEERRGSSKSRCNLCGLGLSAAALGRNVTTAATRSETATAITLETTAALATGTVTATTTRTTGTTTATGREAVATVGVATGAALFNKDLLATNLVGVGSNSGSIAGGLVELNKGAVL
jgi:hypothetical protein